MFDFLKKSFPQLNKESPFYSQAMSNIIVKPHNTYEPLDGKDVFIDGLFAGQIEKLPTSFDPVDSTYYRGFYLQPDSDTKKKLIDEIFNRVQKSIDDEANARINGNNTPFTVNANILKDIEEKTKTINKFIKTQNSIKEITIDKNDVALEFYLQLTDLVFSNFSKILKDMEEKKLFGNIYLNYDERMARIEIRTEYCKSDKKYITRMWLSDSYDTQVFASDSEWPMRHNSIFKKDNLYPLMNKLKKHYEKLGAKNDAEIKQMFIDDIAKQIVECLDRSIESKEWSIANTKENYNIENE
jgi:hypothetical protein